MRKLSHGSIVDGLKHAPGSILEGRVAGNAIEDEDGFDGFRAVTAVSSVRTRWVAFLP
jgi:hypothetical protein